MTTTLSTRRQLFEASWMNEIREKGRYIQGGPLPVINGVTLPKTNIAMENPPF